MARPDDLVLQAPIRETRPAFRFRTFLEGAWYGFRLVYFERDQRWYIDVIDDAGAPIVQGIRVTEGRELFAAFHHLPIPPGQVYCQDTERQGRAPDRHAWQGFSRLYYRPLDVIELARGTDDEVF